MLQPVSFATRKKIFIEYLNLVYSNKSYLKSVFLEMRELATNPTLLLAIDETGADNLSQIDNIYAMFGSINEHITERHIIAAKAMNLEAYSAAINVTRLPLSATVPYFFTCKV
ncbi:MAG: hypothetical protein WC615_03245 [Mucilaginibacter sp.]|jgi:hypothetical protein|uniref:hypothetical protein n=1 Tax=Mucilaginibacter sp. TaxID=1882438 RepID=UPI00356B18C0